MDATESSQHQFDLRSSTTPGSFYSDEFPSLYTSFKTTNKNKKKSKKQTFTLAEFSNYKPPSSYSSATSYIDQGYKVSESCSRGFRNYSGDRDIPRVSRHDSRHMGSDDIKFPSFGSCGVVEQREEVLKEKGQDFMEIEESIGTARKFGSTGIFAYTDYRTSVTPSRKPEMSNPAAAAAKAAEAAAAKALDAALAAYAAAAAAAATAAAAPRPELKPETKASLDYMMKDILAPISNGNGNWNPASPPDVDDPMHLELDQKIMSEQARKALEYYEDTEGEEFELVEIKDNEAALLPPYWINHLTFMAKPKDIPDGCPMLFFAELYERFDHLGEYEVKMCMTLDPSGPDVMKGCGYVQGDEHMLHPKGVKFWAGPPSGTPEWDKENGIGSSSPDAR